MEKEYYVYIMTNPNNMVLYTGVTGDLANRIFQHRSGKGGVFTKRYNINKLVFTEVFTDIDEAIAREKQIKAASRRRKIRMIENQNPFWEDLG